MPYHLAYYTITYMPLPHPAYKWLHINRTCIGSAALDTSTLCMIGNLLPEENEESDEVVSELDIKLLLAHLHLRSIEDLSLVVYTGTSHARAVQIAARERVREGMGYIIQHLVRQADCAKQGCYWLIVIITGLQAAWCIRWLTVGRDMR